MTFEVCIKSGTSGYSDYDDCDMFLACIVNCSLPRENEILEIRMCVDGVWEQKKYIVREIKYRYIQNKDTTWDEFIKVYVINY